MSPRRNKEEKDAKGLSGERTNFSTCAVDTSTGGQTLNQNVPERRWRDVRLRSRSLSATYIRVLRVSESPLSHMESEDDCGNTYLLTLYRPEETEWKVFNGLLYMETLYRALDKCVLSAAVTIFKEANSRLVKMNLELLRALGQTFHTSQASFLVYLPGGKDKDERPPAKSNMPVSGIERVSVKT